MSGVGEIIASSVVNRVVSKLGDLAVEEATLLWRFKDDVDSMKEKMRDLEAVMQDADDKARQGGTGGAAERRWLTKLKSVAYDVEDMLDELDAAQLIKNHQPKLKLYFSCNNPLLQTIIIAHNMKNLRDKTAAIEMDGRMLNLVRHEPHTEGSTSNETFTVNDDMDIGILGRDAETEKIISLLLKTEAKEDISIIPIVGLGGLGKTTLAQAVFADKRVNVFDMRIWVYVSEDFDLLKIGKAIIRGANRSINLDNCDLQFLQDNLKKELANRRYLIVLDDIWEEYGENLEKLKQMLQHGAKDSKIIVTTRNGSVMQVLHTGYLANQRKICPVHEADHINLDVLSHDDCWKVMKRRIFGPDDDQSALEDIGREIAGRCGGLPLVANALGQVMSTQRTIEAWRDIRDRRIVLDFIVDNRRDTLERLLLSYYYMKPDYKMCFTYLATFSNGFVIDSDRLILQWSALGYIQARHNGQSCIDYLLGMSFLQIFRSSSVSPVHAKAPRKLTMHNLVHDLAKIIVANEILVMDVSKPTIWDKDNKRYCRHVQLVGFQKQFEVFKHIPSKIRTFCFIECLEMQLPRKAFSQSKHLRILDLSGCSVQEQSTSSSLVLPSSICRLMLLAYLDVSGFPIISLPKSFHTLQNMQTLILSDCSLEILPANIGSLQKLCYLDLSNNSNLNKLPPSITNLVELYFLNLSGCAKFEELPESIDNLKCLQLLDMSGCCALQKLPDKFGSLTKLLYINLAGCSKLTELPNKLNLESLEHLDLSSCNELEALPGDFGNLNRLEVLNLSDCYKVRVLPETFGQLKHLKELNFSDCHGLKQLPECFGDLSELQNLNLASCSKLQSLPQSLCKIDKLKHLNLSYCIKLENLPYLFGDLKLQVLELPGCYGLQDLPDSINKMTSLTLLDNSTGTTLLRDKFRTIRKLLNLPGYAEHDVHKIENGQISSIMELEQLHCRNLAVRHLEIVEELEDARRAKLRDMAELRDLKLSWGPGGTRDADKGKMVLENLVPPRTLEKFSLRGYLCKDFPNWVSGISSYLPYLIQLSLFNLPTCDSLPAFGQLASLRFLNIEGMPNIRRIGKECYGEEGNCKKLRVIWLEHMDNLEEWWTTRSGKEDEEFLIPNLHYLHVANCPKLSFLPYPPRSMQWTLDGSDQVLPERGFGSLVSSTLPFLVNIKNCQFSPDRWGRLQHFATLEIFRVDGCSGLRTLPDIIQCFDSLRELLLGSWADLETLPECLGQLVFLDSLTIINCPKLSSLPESLRNLTALRQLRLQGCEGLEILPEWLGLLISLKKLLIIDCPKLIFLPESMKNLTDLIELHLVRCEVLEIEPEVLGLLISLENLVIIDCPKLTFMPESMKNLTALIKLKLIGCKGLEILPDGLGQLISLKKLLLINCPKLTFLPESMKNLTGLIELHLVRCEVLEIQPEGLGQLISLKKFVAIDCPKLTFLPESMKNLAALIELRLSGYTEMEISPELFGHLASLKCIEIKSCSNLTYLPESMKNLTSLEELWLRQFNSIPEWLGQFVYLKKFGIRDSPNLVSLPESIWNLTTLKELHILNCPRLVEKCQGEDANKISHIPKVVLDDKLFVPQQAVEESKNKAA